MKKTFIILIVSFLVILSILLAFLFAYQNEDKVISRANSEYEAYLNKEIYGTELVTIINKAIDNNNKKNVQKNENGFFISNDKDSILIYIQMLGKNEKFQMERFLAVRNRRFY